MEKIGAFVGKFYPPHMGHIDAINKALAYCDQVIVVISKNEMRNEALFDKYGFPYLNANQIKNWFEAYYKNNEKVSVQIFDESGLRPYPLDRDIWADKFKKQFPTVNVKIADGGYRQYNLEHFPEYDFFEIDRDYLPIHSTLIRENYEKYKDYVIPTAREELDKMLGNRRENGK